MINFKKQVLKFFDNSIIGLPSGSFLKNINIIEKNNITTIKLKTNFFLIKEQQNNIINQLKNYLYQNNINENFNLEFESKIITHKVNNGLTTIKGIKNIIAIASGKGGVGKSTFTSNLAISLKQSGAHVGILDADLYGPSQPVIMGSHDNPQTIDKNKIEPIICYGIKMMSLGNLVDKKTAIIWRGPMTSKAIIQILHDTNWGNLDYLLIDLPPGTGDIHLTISKKIPLTGVIFITTPQELSLIDVERSIMMFRKLNVYIIGIIENMNLYICPHCQSTSHIFGKNTENNIYKILKIPFIGGIPLDIKIREYADKGYPIAIKNNSYIGKLYQNLSLKIAANISNLPEYINI